MSYNLTLAQILYVQMVSETYQADILRHNGRFDINIK